jgi:hypothetical protein
MRSTNVLSRVPRGMPFAATIKSKNETKPPTAAGLFGWTPNTR